MARFTEAQNLDFVLLYQERCNLWDVTSNYKNKESRHAALKAICDQMNIPGFGIPECKNKIKNIHYQYCQELKKIRESKKCGQGADGVYKPNVPWFIIVDSFLRKYVEQSTKKKLKKSNQSTDEPIEKNTQSSTVSAFTEDVMLDEFSFVAEYPVEDELHEAETGAVTENIPQLPLARKRQKRGEKDDSAISHAISRLEKISSAPTSRRTEFDVFGETVAAHLNAIPLECAIELQLKIQQLISKYRLTLHESQASEVIIYEPTEDLEGNE